MPEISERDRVAAQVRAAIGGAANPTQVGFGVVGIDQASEVVMPVIDPILSARDAHFEARNRMTEQSDHWKERAEAAEAAIERVRAITYASDDGSEFEHTHPDGGEPECPACWVEGIRAVLDGSETP